MIQVKCIERSIKRLKYAYLICPVFYLLIFLVGCDKNGVMCVSGDTPILTPSGNIPAEKLNIGNEIFSYDLTRNILIPAKIADIRRGYDRCIRFGIYSGARLRVTVDHLIFSPETGNYERALKWQSAELSIFYAIGEGMPKTPIVTPLGIDLKKVEVFDITVDSPFGNFIANGILMHNKTPPIYPTPPVDDLEVVETDSNSVTLAWTVPGDLEIYPVEYDVRFLDREWQHDEYWTEADTVTGEPAPSTPGSRDTMTVEGLQDSTTYWFGMTTVSNRGHHSNVSNIVSGITQ